MTGSFDNTQIILIFNIFNFILVKCASTPFYSLKPYTAPFLQQNDKQYFNSKKSFLTNHQTLQNNNAFQMMCIQFLDNSDSDVSTTYANHQLSQIFLCRQLYSIGSELNNNNNNEKEIYDPLLNNYNSEKTMDNFQRSLKSPVYRKEFEILKKPIENTNYLLQLVKKSNNFEAHKNSGKEIIPVKRNYDFIRFGRPDLQINDLFSPFTQQQKKQDDKKTGNTYDYIRFGKRSANFL